MTMSILHRATGIALYAGVILLALWFIAAAFGPGPLGIVHVVFASWIGQIILFGFTWAATYHLLNGIRHLAWDLGFGFLPKTAMWSGIVVVALSILIAIGVFAWAYSVRMGGAIS